MSAPNDLNIKEIEWFYELGRFVLSRHPNPAADPDVAPGRSGMKKLARAAREYICKNPNGCDRWARRKDGLCDACHTYRTTYDRLPGPETLEKRRMRGVA